MDLFVKTPTSDPDLKQLLLDMKMDITEVDFYNVLFKKIKEFEIGQVGVSRLAEVMPKCYLAFYDTDGNDRTFVLALEDLVVQDYKMFNFNDGMNREEVKQMLDTVVILHAVSYVFANKKSVNWTSYFPTLSNMPKHIDNPVFKQLLNDSLSKYLKTGDAGKDKQLADFASKMEADLTELMADDRHKCLVHGDFWTTNIMYRKDGRCKLIDFQFVTCGDPMFDIGLVLLFNSNIEEVKDHFDNLLRHYYMTFNSIAASLDRDGKVPMPWKSFDELKASFESEGYLSSLRFSLINSLLLDKYPGLGPRIDFIMEACFDKGLI